jgi:hypothetical protein
LLHILCVFLGASLLLLSIFFVWCNKWLGPNKFLLEKSHSLFHLPRTLYFSLLSFNDCSIFLELRLAFIFSLNFCSDLVISLHQGVFRALVYVGWYVSNVFIIFDAPCLFLYHLLYVLLHFMAFFCIFWN